MCVNSVPSHVTPSSVSLWAPGISMVQIHAGKTHTKQKKVHLKKRFQITINVKMWNNLNENSAKWVTHTNLQQEGRDLGLRRHYIELQPDTAEDTQINEVTPQQQTHPHYRVPLLSTKVLVTFKLKDGAVNKVGNTVVYREKKMLSLHYTQK